MDLTRPQRGYLAILLGFLLLTVSLILAISWRSPTHRAVLLMGAGLVLLWIVLGGSLMWRFRRTISAYVLRVRLDWRIKFVLFCTLLALIEEAITTLMTNLAPLFGVAVGQAYITASGNYLDVIALHSVSLFVSLFVGWAVILSRYDFSPFAVFVLFGITGTLMEILFGGPQHLAEYAMWTYVYGLMIWLPVCSVPHERGALPPRWWHYPLAVFAPLLFIVLFPLAGILSIVLTHGHHPSIHFPPIR